MLVRPCQCLDAASNEDHEVGLRRTVVDARLKVTVAASTLAATGVSPWDSVTVVDAIADGYCYCRLLLLWSARSYHCGCTVTTT